MKAELAIKNQELAAASKEAEALLKSISESTAIAEKGTYRCWDSRCPFIVSLRQDRLLLLSLTACAMLPGCSWRRLCVNTCLLMLELCLLSL